MGSFVVGVIVRHAIAHRLHVSELPTDDETEWVLIIGPDSTVPQSHKGIAERRRRTVTRIGLIGLTWRTERDGRCRGGHWLFTRPR